MKKRRVSTIRDQVYEMLKEEICDGKFPSGQWLLEQELASRYLVSRSPVREALRRLAADGLVEEVPNKGVFVREFTGKDIREIYDVRVLLESYAIDQLKNNLTQADAQGLLELLEELELAYERKDLTEYIRMDTKLHGGLVCLCGNSMVEELYERVYGRIKRFRRYSLSSPVRYAESMEEHRQMVKAIVVGNTTEAKRINCRHLELARDKVMEYLRQQEANRESL